MDPIAPVAAMLTVAARTPGSAVLWASDPDRVFLCVDSQTVLSVTFDKPDGAMADFAGHIDALRGSPTGAVPALYGWLGYDAARAPHRGPRSPSGDARPFGDRCPAAFLAAPGAVLTFEQSTGTMVFPEDRGERERLLALMACASGHTLAREPMSFGSATSREEHMSAVSSVRESIRGGEVYLVNVARMLHADGSSVESMAARVLAARARYGALIHTEGCVVGAMSMELALRWDRARARALTRPIKGTRSRKSDPEEDRAEALALAQDPKELAENAMAVDLHRNDLGRVARTGSVEVTALCAVEAHTYVHHMVSTVRAEVGSEVGAWALLASMLPVGSVTGAPKLAAMDTIARVEKERRGLYTGVYGMAYGGGGFDLAVAIRTLVRDAGGLHYGVGGGVVWDSDPEREWAELGWKQRGAE